MGIIVPLNEYFASRVKVWSGLKCLYLIMWRLHNVPLNSKSTVWNPGLLQTSRQLNCCSHLRWWRWIRCSGRLGNCAAVKERGDGRHCLWIRYKSWEDGREVFGKKTEWKKKGDLSTDIRLKFTKKADDGDYCEWQGFAEAESEVPPQVFKNFRWLFRMEDVSESLPAHLVRFVRILRFSRMACWATCWSIPKRSIRRDWF